MLDNISEFIFYLRIDGFREALNFLNPFTDSLVSHFIKVSKQTKSFEYHLNYIISEGVYPFYVTNQQGRITENIIQMLNEESTLLHSQIYIEAILSNNSSVEFYIGFERLYARQFIKLMMQIGFPLLCKLVFDFCTAVGENS